MEYGYGGELSVQMDGPFAGSGSGGSGSARVVTINAPAANWKGGESPYSMAVGVDGINISSKVDVHLNPEQMKLLKDQIITFVAQNESGNVTLYAFGDKPAADLVLQATVTDTNGSGAILGGSASTVAPRSDYAQTDPTKSDFIHNKPDAAIRRAQSTADSAKTTAEAALPKSGGSMTGGINMGGKSITNLASPSADTDAVNKGYVREQVSGTYKPFTATLSVSGWSENAPYTQKVNVSGVLQSDRPHVGLVPSDDTDTALAQEESWGYVSRGVTADGSITFTCYEEKPQVDIPLQIEVNR